MNKLLKTNESITAKIPKNNIGIAVRTTTPSIPTTGLIKIIQLKIRVNIDQNIDQPQFLIPIFFISQAKLIPIIPLNINQKPVKIITVVIAKPGWKIMANPTKISNIPIARYHPQSSMIFRLVSEKIICIIPEAKISEAKNILIPTNAGKGINIR